MTNYEQSADFGIRGSRAIDRPVETMSHVEGVILSLDGETRYEAWKIAALRHNVGAQRILHALTVAHSEHQLDKSQLGVHYSSDNDFEPYR